MRKLVAIVIILFAHLFHANAQLYLSATIGKSLGGDGVYLGNSIVAGVGLSNQDDRWPTLLTEMLGGVEVNYGISSSTLEKRSPVDPICCGINLLDRLDEIPDFTSRYSLLFIAFGINDWGYNGVNYTPTNFITDGTTAINNAISKGFPLHRIVIVSPTYPLDDAFSFYAAINGGNPPDRVGIENFVSAAQTLATNLGVRYVDLYHTMEANTPASLIQADGVHPNEAGHLLIATTIYNYLTQ